MVKIDDLIQKSDEIEAAFDRANESSSFYCCCYIARQKLEQAKLLVFNSDEQNKLIASAEEILNKHHD